MGSLSKALRSIQLPERTLSIFLARRKCCSHALHMLGRCPPRVGCSSQGVHPPVEVVSIIGCSHNAVSPSSSTSPSPAPPRSLAIPLSATQLHLLQGGHPPHRPRRMIQAILVRTVHPSPQLAQSTPHHSDQQLHGYTVQGYRMPMKWSRGTRVM